MLWTLPNNANERLEVTFDGRSAQEVPRTPHAVLQKIRELLYLCTSTRILFSSGLNKTVHVNN